MDSKTYSNHAQKATLNILKSIAPYKEVPWDGIDFSNDVPIVTFGVEKCHALTATDGRNYGMFHVHANDPVDWYIAETRKKVQAPVSAIYISGLYANSMPNYYRKHGIDVLDVHDDMKEFGKIMKKDIIVFPSLKEVMIIAGNMMITKKFRN